MGGYRNYTLEALEQDRIAYRHMAPKHPDMTAVEYIRRKHQRRAWMLAGVILTAVAITVKSCAG